MIVENPSPTLDFATSAGVMSADRDFGATEFALMAQRPSGTRSAEV
jgi:hypothetical protein